MKFWISVFFIFISITVNAATTIVEPPIDCPSGYSKVKIDAVIFANDTETDSLSGLKKLGDNVVSCTNKNAPVCFLILTDTTKQYSDKTGTFEITAECPI